MQRKIYLTTTFREFDESEDSELQRRFLLSLTQQSYQNFVLVVSLFGEKHVKDVVESYLHDKAIFVDSVARGYKYSTTKTMLNGIDVAVKDSDSILGWTTSDVILQSNYFENVNNYYKKDFVVTTHPNMMSNDVSQYDNGVYYVSDIWGGIDTIFFATKIFQRPKVYNYFIEYDFKGYGGFEFFLTAIAVNESNHRYNLFRKSDIYKIQNVNKRDECDDKEFQFIGKEAERNMKILKEFLTQQCGGDEKFLTLNELHFMYSLQREAWNYRPFFLAQKMLLKEFVVNYRWRQGWGYKKIYRTVTDVTRLLIPEPEYRMLTLKSRYY